MDYTGMISADRLARVRIGGAGDNIMAVGYSGEWKDSSFIKKIEKESTTVLLYEAMGFTKHDLDIRTNFENLTKKTTLLIKGEVDFPELEWKSEINLKIPIDTTKYHRSVVKVRDGILIIELVQIQNERPDFRVV